MADYSEYTKEEIWAALIKANKLADAHQQVATLWRERVENLLGALESIEDNMDGDVFVEPIKRAMYLGIIRAAIAKAKGGK